VNDAHLTSTSRSEPTNEIEPSPFAPPPARASALARWLRRLGNVFVLALALVVGVLALMIGLDRPTAPEPDSAMLRPFAAVDFQDLPPTETVPARDGTALAFRRYPGAGVKIAVLVHGASGSGASMHALAKALQQRGDVTVYAVDVRGHGDSGRRGDADHIGQIEEDMEDFLAAVRTRHPGAPLTLVGFSAGGGLALRIAAGPHADRFERYVLLAPPLGYGSTASRSSHGHYAVATKRILGLWALNLVGIHMFDHLTVLAFGVPPAMAHRMTGTYSFRLLMSFGPHADPLNDIRRSTQPMSILVGEGDEVVDAQQYPPLVTVARSDVAVQLLPSLGHTELVTKPAALDAVVAAVTGRLAQGSRR